MAGVFDGFATLALVIALGFALAHWRVFGTDAQLMLSRLAFFVASPALLVTVLEGTDVAQVFSKTLVASACSVAVAAGIYAILAHTIWHKTAADTLIGALSSAYVNAGNLGIPIAAYVLGDAALVAPVLVLQLVVLQPLALAGLDTSTSEGSTSAARMILRSLANPLLLGTLLGLFLSLTGISLPTAIHAPLELIAGMAVPAMLLAFGISLRLGPRPISGASGVEIAVITLLKLAVQPAAAYMVARYVFGLEGTTLYAVTVIAALPTAQNIFVHATRYNRSVILARDAIFVTTLGSVPVILAISALLA